MAKLSAKGILKSPSRVFYGWWIVLVSVIADGMKHGTFNRGFTVYIIPIQLDLGLSTAAIGWADTLGRLMGGLQGPLMGYLTDRVGPRIMLAFGGLMSGLGFILLSLSGNYFFFLLIFVGFLSVGFRSGYNNASIAAVNNWFRRKRGMAMSVVSMGNGLGGAIAPLIGLLVVAVGWRSAAMISGIAIIAVVLPLSLVVRRSPEDMGMLPDGDVPESDIAGSPETGARQESAGARTNRGYREMDFTAREGMRTPSYWLLILATALRNTVHSGMSFLLAPVMIWFLLGGEPEPTRSLLKDPPGEIVLLAATFVAVVAISNIVFNPFVGWLGDRFPKKKLSALCMVSGGLALMVLVNRSGNVWQLVLFSVLLAFAESANPLNWAIMGDFFGRRAYATLRGWQHLPDQLISMWTSVWMGLIVDHTGSYYWALLPLALIYGLAAIGYWTIPSPRLPERLRLREEARAAGMP